MQAISHQRKIFYILLLGCLPLVLAMFNLYSTSSEQEAIGFELDYAISQANSKVAKERLNRAVKKRFQNSDHFYIDKEIETITPLSQEIERIRALLHQGYHHEEEQLKKRLQFLTNGQNKISFIEGSVKAYPTYKEIAESLAHPVEVNLEDLKTILSKIEGSSTDTSPHLIITDCKIDRKMGQTQEIFSLDIKALKREYLK